MDDFTNDEDAIYSGWQDYSVEDALAALPIDSNNIIPAEIVFGFSDLLEDELEQVRPVWEKLPTDQRLALMDRLADASEADYALDFSIFAKLGYDDPEARVRIASIKAGWSDETPETLHKLIGIADRDPVTEVRATALEQIGMYIQLGELEDRLKPETAIAEDFALRLVNDPNENLDVQRRALEAIAHSSRPEVPALIKAAYNHDDVRMRIGAVNAMGSSCDDVWTAIVLEELQNEDNEMCFEAIRAAGTIGIEDAVNLLAELAYSEDSQLQDAAIWSLGEIGGEDAIEFLYQLSEYAEGEDNDLLSEAIDDALSMAEVLTNFGQGMDMFDMDFITNNDDEAYGENYGDDFDPSDSYLN